VTIISFHFEKCNDDIDDIISLAKLIHINDRMPKGIKVMRGMQTMEFSIKLCNNSVADKYNFLEIRNKFYDSIPK
jgi:hypothetical protein